MPCGVIRVEGNAGCCRAHQRLETLGVRAEHDGNGVPSLQLRHGIQRSREHGSSRDIGELLWRTETRRTAGGEHHDVQAGRGRIAIQHLPVSLAMQMRLDFGGDRERDARGIAPAEFEPDRRVQSRSELRRGCRTEVGQQSLASRRRAEQPHVGDRSRGQHLERREVGRDVVAHDDRRIEPRQVHVLRQLRRRGLQHQPRARESRRVRVRRPVICHRDAPAQRRTDFHDRQGVGPAAEQQQFAWDRRPWRRIIALGDASNSIVPAATGPGGSRPAPPAMRRRVAAVPGTASVRRPARASCPRAGAGAAESSTKAYRARTRCSKHLCQGREGLPVGRRIEPEEPDIHAAFAAGA